MPTQPFYVTTPIYYVNDRPHIGHCYTSMVGDCVARFMRLAGRDVFFLTGTDEHADRVVTTGAEHGCTPIQWADRNAAAFQEAFRFFGFSNDDFVRTTQRRHIEKVEAYIKELLAKGDVFLGDYEGWYDVSQDEYVTETTARENDFKSPVTGKPLVKKTEKNYFFNLPKYEKRLLEYIEKNPGFIRPEARKNEILGRIREGLQRVPVSRAVNKDDPSSQWGILMPGDPSHRIYVWIDALFNYLSVVDTPERVKYWPAQLHVMAKDIVWFHAVIWPCLLMALEKPLPECVYAHSYWIREGRKMSKSLGNFLDLETIKAYCQPAPAGFGIDAFRWFLLTQGPLGATDADFVHTKFVEVYNADLANGIGNAASRVANMFEKYFGGIVPGKFETYGQSGQPANAQEYLEYTVCSPLTRLTGIVEAAVEDAAIASRRFDLESYFYASMAISRAVDACIDATQPFKLAKDPASMWKVGVVLHDCAEALRIAAVLLSPAMPGKMADLLERLGQEKPAHDGGFSQPIQVLCRWGGLKAGTNIVKGDPLFPRWDSALPPPAPRSQGI